jgi:hypothetical protein
MLKDIIQDGLKQATKDGNFDADLFADLLAKKLRPAIQATIQGTQATTFLDQVDGKKTRKDRRQELKDYIAAGHYRRDVFLKYDIINTVNRKLFNG